ncbi:MAG: hypothetical protein H6765_02760 [Candidatus Peribacteria bacterium]|nr:MAG: hypothetical protein H6765_02760 [Candidatus Peribacteria bacterium]
MIAVLESTQQNDYTSGFREAMQYIDELAAVQYADETGTYSVLFVKADSQQALDKIQEIGLVVGDNSFESIQLATHMWVYGDASSLAYVQNLTTEKITQDARWKTLVSQIGAGTYNMGFISTPGMMASPNPLVQQFATKLYYTVALSHLEPGNIQ